MQPSHEAKPVGIYYNGGSYPKLERWAAGGSGILKSAILKIARLTTFQRNPRPLQYMETLAKAHFPDLEKVIDVADMQQIQLLPWSLMTACVLLWPDPCGAGWGPIERQVRRLAGSRPVLILNGRKRRFDFDGKIFRQMRFRRFLEKSHIHQIILSVIFLVVTPVLWVVDSILGKD